MGLSINIHVTAPASLSISEIDRIINRWHERACAFADAGKFAHVFGISGELDNLNRFATHWLSVTVPGFPNTITGMAVPPIEGRMFLVRVGEGCEPLALGLCRYPESVSVAKGESGGVAERDLMPTSVGEGWHFRYSCKTQYAGTRGWEHLKQCHTSAIELAAAASAFGVTVDIDDEGGWWPTRNESALRETLQRYDKIMAGFAGALKDQLDSDDDTKPHDERKRTRLQAAIFEHPDFERLEAECRIGDDDQKIQEALRRIKNELDQ
jgi:hypothetical protein